MLANIHDRRCFNHLWDSCIVDLWFYLMEMFTINLTLIKNFHKICFCESVAYGGLFSDCIQVYGAGGHDSTVAINILYDDFIISCDLELF